MKAKIEIAEKTSEISYFNPEIFVLKYFILCLFG